MPDKREYKQAHKPASINYQVRLFGKTQSVKEWLKSGDPRIAITNRYVYYCRVARTGLSPEDALTAPKRETENGKLYTYNGKTLNVSQWSKQPECLVTANTFRNRMYNQKDKWSFFSALRTPIIGRWERYKPKAPVDLPTEIRQSDR